MGSVGKQARKPVVCACGAGQRYRIFAIGTAPRCRLAGPLVGLVASTYGWRTSFVVIALLGLVWVLIWALAVRDLPEHSSNVSAEERDYIVQNRVNVETQTLSVHTGDFLTS